MTVGALMRSSHVHFMVDPGVRVFSHSLGRSESFPQLPTGVITTSEVITGLRNS